MMVENRIERVPQKFDLAESYLGSVVLGFGLQFRSALQRWVV